MQYITVINVSYGRNTIIFDASLNNKGNSRKSRIDIIDNKKQNIHIILSTYYIMKKQYLNNI